MEVNGSLLTSFQTSDAFMHLIQSLLLSLNKKTLPMYWVLVLLRDPRLAYLDDLSSADTSIAEDREDFHPF